VNKLQIAFAGTPELAANVLNKLINSSHSIKAVYTQPDRRAGRGQKNLASAVKTLANQHNLPLFQPETAAEICQGKQLANVDVLVVVAYGMLLPEIVLELPTYGCINIHTSLLPRWRGAAPIQRAIQAGDTETGVSIMQIDTGLDTGPILTQTKCPITPADTAESLQNKLADLGGSCLLDVLNQIADGTALARPQNETEATYAHKITKLEAKLDWDTPAIELERTIRAFNPAPVAYTELNGIRLRIWQAAILNKEAQYAPGTILDCSKDGIDIATKESVLRLLKIQPPGKRIQSVSEFLNGRPDFTSIKHPS
jgi:methionyl-tRNA formyltransferase